VSLIRASCSRRKTHLYDGWEKKDIPPFAVKLREVALSYFSDEKKKSVTHCGRLFRFLLGSAGAADGSGSPST